MTINFFWLDGDLNLISLLGLKSFIDHNHDVVLWSYSKPSNLIDGVELKDANEILNSDKIFLYEGNGDCRRGSCGGFSDLFRYYLLYKIGGWYCDTDVTCLSNFGPIDNTEYVLRSHTRTLSVANIIKCPPKTDFMKNCIEKTEKEINFKNNSWIRPVIIFSQEVIEHKLQNFIVPEKYFGLDDQKTIKNLIDIGYFRNKFNLPQYAIHWCSEFITSGNWNYELKRDLNYPVPTTLYHKLLKKHKLII
jgi:hypothetical protein